MGDWKASPLKYKFTLGSMFAALRPLWLRLIVFLLIVLPLALATRGGFGLLLLAYLVVSRSIFNRMVASGLKTGEPFRLSVKAV
jgi:hypothetical protein